MIALLIFIATLALSDLSAMERQETSEIKFSNPLSKNKKRDWPQPTQQQIQELSDLFKLPINNVTNLLAILAPNEIYQQELQNLFKCNLSLFDALADLYHITWEQFGGINRIFLFLNQGVAFTPITMEVLLEAGGDPNYKTSGFQTSLLEHAAMETNAQICQILLDAHADPNYVDFIGQTALAWAISGQYQSIVSDSLVNTVRTLLRYNASANFFMCGTFGQPEYNNLEQLKQSGLLFNMKFYQNNYLADMAIIRALLEWYFYKINNPLNLSPSDMITRITNINTVITLLKEYNGSTSDKALLKKKIDEAIHIMEQVIGENAGTKLDGIVNQYLNGDTPQPTLEMLEHCLKNQFPNQHVVIRLNNK